MKLAVTCVCRVVAVCRSKEQCVQRGWSSQWRMCVMSLPRAGWKNNVCREDEAGSDVRVSCRCCMQVQRTVCAERMKLSVTCVCRVVAVCRSKEQCVQRGWSWQWCKEFHHSVHSLTIQIRCRVIRAFVQLICHSYLLMYEEEEHWVVSSHVLSYVSWHSNFVTPTQLPASCLTSTQCAVNLVFLLCNITCAVYLYDAAAWVTYMDNLLLVHCLYIGQIYWRCFSVISQELGAMLLSLFIMQHSSIHHLSCDDCLEDKRENYQNCSVLCCVRQLYTIDMHSHMSSS